MAARGIVLALVLSALPGHGMLVTVDAIPPTASTTPAIERACRRITPERLLRIDGDFGRFYGYASSIGPEGLADLRVEPTRPSVESPGSLGWDRIHRLDVRGTNAGRGAVIGGVGLGALSGLAGLALAEVVAASYGDENTSVGGIALASAAAGAGVGLVLGAIVGATISSWHAVYHR